MNKEKKAIKELNHYINITPYWKQEEYTNNDIDNYIKIVLDLVEKQQKDIEEKNIAINKMSKDISHQLKEIEEKSIIINQLLEDMKERANNFSYESEIM